MIHFVLAAIIAGAAKLLTGAQARWKGCAPSERQRIYFANHTSHLDFLLLWIALPPSLRRRTRPVAAADYWNGHALRRYLISRVFRGVLIARQPHAETFNPLAPAQEALRKGESLILFPEGTRGSGERLLAFKPGIFLLARTSPDAELVPAWIDNSYRAMPKGSFLPVPFLCSVHFGAPVRLFTGEEREAFLARLRQALEEMRIE